MDEASAVVEEALAQMDSMITVRAAWRRASTQELQQKPSPVSGLTVATTPGTTQSQSHHGNDRASFYIGSDTDSLDSAIQLENHGNGPVVRNGDIKSTNRTSLPLSGSISADGERRKFISETNFGRRLSSGETSFIHSENSAKRAVNHCNKVVRSASDVTRGGQSSNRKLGVKSLSFTRPNTGATLQRNQVPLHPSNQESAMSRPPRDSESNRKYIRQWLDSTSGQQLDKQEPDAMVRDRLRRVISERDTLQLQVSCLNDQVEAQSETLRELGQQQQRSIDNRHLRRREKQPPDELISRTSLETHKLDLMAEISQLKLKLATSDRDRQQLDEKLNVAQNRIDDMQKRLEEKATAMKELRNAIGKNGTVDVTSEPPADKMSSSSERDHTLERLKRKHSEVDKLKKAVECLITANKEKDQHISELRKTLKRYRKIEEMVLSASGKKDLATYLAEDDRWSEGSSREGSAPSTESSQDATVKPDMFERLEILEPGDSRRSPAMPTPSATSTPVNPSQGSLESSPSTAHPASPPSTIGIRTPTPKKNMVRSNSAEEVTPLAKTPPTVRRRGDQVAPYGTLPRENARETSPRDAVVVVGSRDRGRPPVHPGSRSRARPTSPGSGSECTRTLPPMNYFRSNSSGAGSPLTSPSSAEEDLRAGGSLPRSSSGGTRAGGARSGKTQPSRKHLFGKSFLRLRTSNKWSTSAPNLVEADGEALKDEMAQQYRAMTQNAEHAQSRQSKKSRSGLKRFFGRLRRSSSQDLDEERLGNFTRNGFRATAGPRLGWSRDLKPDLDVPFSRWDTDRVALWLHTIGLSQYVGDCKRWVRNGDLLLKATAAELERELGVRNLFHRKKLQLHLRAIATETRGRMDELDHNWVQRWLDDVGLPQYKDTFVDARIDGRMLHYLTVEDLLGLKVSNALHHLSIKRGINVLRNNDFNPSCLQRRSLPDESMERLKNIPSEVSLWTNHRVMEWLRTIDLSEYAPNMRGSGVHGALMVLEPRFSSEMLAAILSIPHSKTLLRRHLHTHFVALIGSDTQFKKREFEAQPGYSPLTPNQKIKMTKKYGIFGHRRTRSDGSGPGSDLEDFVCPMENGKAVSERTAKEAQGLSNDINTLTTRLSAEKFLEKDVPTSNV